MGKRAPLSRLARSAVALALLAVLAGAPAAQADHVTASVSATATLGKVVRVWQRDDGGDTTFPAHGRRVTVSWQSSCGAPLSPDVDEDVRVAIVAIRPDGTRRPIIGPDPVYGSDTSESFDVGPGTRFVAEVTVTCTGFVSGGPDHVSTASASSEELYLPPQVVAARTIFPIRISCHSVPISKLDVWLQQGDREYLKWYLWRSESLLAPGVPEARQVKLFARGAGLDLRNRSPNRYMLRRWHAIGLSFVPRRAGTLRIWAKINGERTDTLPVKVLSRRC